MSFSEAFVAKRLRHGGVFYAQVDALIDWKGIESLIRYHYTLGKSASGRPAYSGLLLFKMLLIGIWKGLSDRDVEEEVSVNLKAMRFCGLTLEDNVPDHSVLSRFRSTLTEARVWDALLAMINAQMDAQGVMVKTGVSVDASLTEAPRRPRGKPVYEIAQDRQEEQRCASEKAHEQEAMRVIEVHLPGVDAEGRWLKKGGKSIYGYKQHVLTDAQGLVIAVHTTAANVHDSRILEPLLDEAALTAGTRLHADKAYRSMAHNAMLKRKALKNGMHYRAARNNALTPRQKQFNRGVSGLRYTIERTFGGMKKWFGAGVARYRGMAKMHTQHALEAMAYNLKRLPVLWAKAQLTRGAELRAQGYCACYTAVG